jgi:hypothetical protein
VQTQAPRCQHDRLDVHSCIRNYRLKTNADSSLALDLELLQPKDGINLEETKLEFQIAKSGQIHAPVLDDKASNIEFKNSNGEDLTAKLQSSDLYFVRRHLENRTEDELSAGDIGRAEFKLVMDLNPILPPGKDAAEPKALRHFNYSYGKKSGLEGDVKAGLRILSVDLGIRRFAACSVFELRSDKPAGALSYRLDVGDDVLHAMHFGFELRVPLFGPIPRQS